MKKGEIWTVELPSKEGHEQSGKRPALVLTKPNTNMVIVAPLTTNEFSLRFDYTHPVSSTTINGLSSYSIILVFHIQAIDKKRLRHKLGIIEENHLNQTNTLLKNMLEI